MEREDKEEAIEDLQEQIKEKQAEINNFELDSDDFTEQYDDMLDELSTVKIGNLEYSPSHVLKEVDPIAYREGLLNFVDGIELDESPDYQELQEELTELEEELETLDEDE